MENPFILVILIGVLSSIFKRFKAGQQEHPKRKPVRPKTINSAPIRMENVDTTKTRARTVKNQQEIQLGNKMKNLESQYRNIKQEVTTKQAPNQSNRQVERAVGSGRLRESGEMKVLYEESKLPVREQTLVDAIVWSEILGPPRAKNPHSGIIGRGTREVERQ